MNSDVETRLDQCFLNVFPELENSPLADASTDSVASWDSVAQITLLAAVSEEFGIEFEPDDYAQLVSRQSILQHVRRNSPIGDE
jgi:acyl carrier protein